MSDVPTDQIHKPEFELRHRLARALEHSGKTRAELATELDLHLNTVSNYLNGRTDPPRDTVKAWAAATGVDPLWLEIGDEPF